MRYLDTVSYIFQNWNGLLYLAEISFHIFLIVFFNNTTQQLSDDERTKQFIHYKDVVTIATSLLDLKMSIFSEKEFKSIWIEAWKNDSIRNRNPKDHKYIFFTVENTNPKDILLFLSVFYLCM